MRTIDDVFGISAKALAVRSQRMEVLSQNIANADTPNYKARDIKFSKVLEDVGYNQLNTTANMHMPIAEGSEHNGMMYRIPLNNSFDGNTVELNIEQAQFGQAAGDYQATLNILENRINSFKRALRGD
ncbi:MAG: flagellar basal body rod protein FlgB [Hylemonella sp.]|jgi:flagellar basal-body rod protein FlgB